MQQGSRNPIFPLLKNSESPCSTLLPPTSPCSQINPPSNFQQLAPVRQNSLSMFQKQPPYFPTHTVSKNQKLRQIKKKRSELRENLARLEIEQKYHTSTSKPSTKGEEFSEIETISALMKNYKRFQKLIQKKTSQYEEQLEVAKKEMIVQERRIRDMARGRRSEISEENLKIMKKREEIRRQEHLNGVKESGLVKRSKPLFQKMAERWKEQEQLMKEDKKEDSRKEIVRKVGRDISWKETRQCEKQYDNVINFNEEKKDKKKIERKNVNSLYFYSPSYQNTREQEGQMIEQMRKYESNLPKIKREKTQQYFEQVKEESNKFTIKGKQNKSSQIARNLRSLSFNQTFNKKKQQMKQNLSHIQKRPAQNIHTQQNKQNQNMKYQNYPKQLPNKITKLKKKQRQKHFVSDLLEAAPSSCSNQLKQEPIKFGLKCPRSQTQQSTPHLVKIQGMQQFQQLQYYH